MNPILTPIFDDATARWAKWKNPSQADAVRILGPVLEAVCADAKVPATRATEWLQAQAPEAITREDIDAFVRDITEAPAHVLAAARAKQAQIEMELANQRPLTARELVMQERMKPLSERPIESIEEELFESYWGHLRVFVDGRYRRGAELPNAVSRAMRPHEELQAELDKRECVAYGVAYVPAKQHDSLGHVPRMRG